MSSVSTIYTGLQGIQKGMNGLTKNAQAIARGNIPEQAPGVNDITQPLIEMKLNALQVEASAKVVQASSDLIGTLLDIKA